MLIPFVNYLTNVLMIVGCMGELNDAVTHTHTLSLIIENNELIICNSNQK